jgi:Tfp pilus assembly protein PilV
MVSLRATPRVRRRRAVALLDALVASIILGLALAAILSMSSQALSSQASGEQIATAAMLADEQLNFVVARGADDYAKRFPVEGACDEPFGQYRYKLEFAGGDGAAYQVRATVFYTVGAREQSLTIETAIAPRPGDDPDPDRRPAQPVERVQ